MFDFEVRAVNFFHVYHVMLTLSTEAPRMTFKGRSWPRWAIKGIFHLRKDTPKSKGMAVLSPHPTPHTHMKSKIELLDKKQIAMLHFLVHPVDLILLYKDYPYPMCQGYMAGGPGYVLSKVVSVIL